MVDDGGQGVSQHPEIVNYDNIIVSQCVVSPLKSYVCFATESGDRSMGKGAGRCISRGSMLLPSHLRPWLLCFRHPELASVGPRDAASCTRSPPALGVLPAGSHSSAPWPAALSRPSGRVLMSRLCQHTGAIGGRRQGPGLASLSSGPAYSTPVDPQRTRREERTGPEQRTRLDAGSPAGPRERKTPESHSRFVSSPPSCVLLRSASGSSETEKECA